MSKIGMWALKTRTRAEALDAQTPLVSGKYTDDEGHPVAVREGRSLRRLPEGGDRFESHADAARRLARNASVDLERATSLDCTALFMDPDAKGNLKPAAALLGAPVGMMADLLQAPLRLASAAGYGLVSLYHERLAK